MAVRARDRPKVRPLVIGLILALLWAGILIWLWQTARATSPGFPGPLLTAQGLLLTALVFVLGFGQAHFQRTRDSLLETMQEHERQVLQLYRADPSTMTTFRLLEWAHNASQDAIEARNLHDESQAKVRGLAREHRRLQHVPDSRERAILDIVAIDRRLKDGAEGRQAESEKNRKWLERERTKLVVQADRDLKLMRDTERVTGIVGTLIYSGQFRIGLGAAYELLYLARATIWLMLFLGTVGAVYMGWPAAPAPELWAVLVLLLLAGGYTFIIGRNISDTARGLGDGLSRSPLVTLDTTEDALAWSTLPQERVDEYWKNYYEPRLHLVARAEPTLPWLDSLLGRRALRQALKEKDHADRMRPEARTHSARPVESISDKLRSHIELAEELLRAASTRQDDPVAAVAYARLCELQADLDPGRADELGPEADRFILRAVALLGSFPLKPRYSQIIQGRGATLCRERIYGAPWLWPRDGKRRDLLNSAIPAGRDLPSI